MASPRKSHHYYVTICFLVAYDELKSSTIFDLIYKKIITQALFRVNKNLTNQ